MVCASFRLGLRSPSLTNVSPIASMRARAPGKGSRGRACGVDGAEPNRGPGAVLGAGRYAQAAKKQAMTSAHVGEAGDPARSAFARDDGPALRRSRRDGRHDSGASVGRRLRWCPAKALHASARVRGARAPDIRPRGVGEQLDAHGPHVVHAGGRPPGCGRPPQALSQAPRYERPDRRSASAVSFSSSAWTRSMLKSPPRTRFAA